MARKRKKKGSRKAENIVFIVCEGSKDKSEHAYFKELIRSRRFHDGKIPFKVIDTKKNSARELVALVKNKKEYDKDEAWAVFDKDGYTLHAEAFEMALQSNVKIAFSSISFEYWILLHFEYTSTAFSKSEKVIKYIRDKGYMQYSKADKSVFSQTKDKINSAIANAKKIQKYQKDSDPNNKIYEFNPYTDVNVLVEAIRCMSKPV